MINTYFSPRQIVDVDRNSEHILNRYGIAKTSNKSILDNAFSNNFNGLFIVDLLNCFYEVENIAHTDFEKYEIPTLVDYLKRSHKYYISKRIPEIEQTIDNITSQESNILGSFLKNFFKQYKYDLQRHFDTEEKNIFPFALKLYNYHYFDDVSHIKFLKERQNFVMKFLDNHKKEKSELKKIEQSLIEYKSKNATTLSYLDILLQKLKNFHVDMKIHSEIEDNVLDNKIKYILKKSRL